MLTKYLFYFIISVLVKVWGEKSWIFGVDFGLNLDEVVESLKGTYKRIKKDNSGELVYYNRKRRSGSLAYTHSTGVASLLEQKKEEQKNQLNESILNKCIIAGLFHDILEDTVYDEKYLKYILEDYIKRKAPKECVDDPNFVEDILTAVKLVSKNKGVKDTEKIPEQMKGIMTKEQWKQIAIKKFNDDDENQMREYLTNIKNNEIAILVKLADRIDNLADFAITDPINKRGKFIKETEKYYVELAQGTMFEKDLDRVLDNAIEMFSSIYGIKYELWKNSYEQNINKKVISANVGR